MFKATIWAQMSFHYLSCVLELRVLDGLDGLEFKQVIHLSLLLNPRTTDPVTAAVVRDASQELCEVVSLRPDALSVKLIHGEFFLGSQHLLYALPVEHYPALKIVFDFDALVAAVVGIDGPPVLLAKFFSWIKFPLSVTEVMESAILLHDTILRSYILPSGIRSVV